MLDLLAHSTLAAADCVSAGFSCDVVARAR